MGKFQSVQAARGVAALLVAIFHGQEALRHTTGVAPFGGFFEFGHSGVDFFFVLSGFIIYHVHRSDINARERLPSYIWKRITRIYPLFIFLMLFVTAKFVLNGEFNWPQFIKTILLLPQPPYPMLIQSWTLVHEVIFYLFFGLAIYSAVLGRVALVMWLISFPLCMYLHPNLGTGIFADFVRTLESPYNLLFLVGIAVAWAVERGAVPFPRVLVAAGAAGYLAIGVAENNHLFEQSTITSIGFFGLASGLLLMGLVSAEVSGHLRAGKFGDFLGDLSYPLYLVHGAVIGTTIAVFSKIDWQIPGWFLLFIGVMNAGVAAYLINRIVEKPMALFLRAVWVGRESANKSVLARQK